MDKYDSERFWSKVDKSGECWLWTAGKICGYGQYTLPGRISSRAHRVSWAISNGEIPAGMLVCHKCDVKNCVRPDHLFLGTDKDNAADCVAKGRNTKGQMVGRSRLNKEKVLAIRGKYKPRVYSQRRLAKEYGVSRSTIQTIIERRFWNHV